jgi:surface antigen
MIAAVVAAIVAVVLSLLSWLPGFNSTQETMTPATVGDYDLVDDYPWKGHYNDGVDPLGYELGNCTSFVAWRMNRDIGVTRAPWKLKNAQLTPLGGNGGQWGATGNMPGWKIVTSPSPGDIISIPAGVELLGSSGGPYGHVGYIAQVDGNKVTIENYGHGKYFLTKPTVTQLSSYIARGEAVIKHNPKGRVTAGGSSAAKAYARKTLHDDQQYQCLVTLWNHESGWRVKADNPTSDAYGIPQALPGSKMASEGSDWKTNGVTQVKWGLKYIAGRPDYGTPCKAWELWQSRSPHWY